MNPITTQPTTLPAATPGQLLATAGVLLILVGGAMTLVLAWANGYWRTRLADQPRRVLTRSRAVGLLGTAAAMFAASAVAPALVPLAGVKPTAADVRAFAAMTVVGPLAGLAVALLAHRRLRDAHASLGLRRPTEAIRPALATLLVGMSATLIVQAAAVYLMSRLGYPPQPHPTLPLMRRASSGTLAALVLTVVAVVPLFEELLFRGHLQSALTYALRSRASAVVVTSALFALIHPWWVSPGAFPMLPAIFTLSLALGYAYERTSNLWVPIGAHALFNGLQTAAAFAIADPLGP